MQSNDPLIQTKLRLPFTRPELVARPRLQDQVAHGLNRPLILIIAPAGFGKTTLLASYITGLGMPIAWLSLDKNDNQEERFLRYLAAALHEADAAVGVRAGQMLASAQTPQSEVVLTSLINDLDGIFTEIVLVFDDYHCINSQAVHDAVRFLLDHCPGKLHLVISTRSDPPLPLARLRARDQIAEIRSSDLRFTEVEAAQFLNEIMGFHLDAESIAMLENRTEGWIAGLQMAALSLRNRENVSDFITGFSGTNRYILDYLLEEVLSNQPPEIQRFLLYTSVLERLTAPLCDFILNTTELPVSGRQVGSGSDLLTNLPSASVLSYLEQACLFLTPLDDERSWYRYHHLFADLLLARLNQSQPELLPVLHSRASTWLEREGFITEAIQHLFAIHQIDQAAALIEKYGPAQWMESDPSVLQLADQLPYEQLLARPILGLRQVWRLITQGRIENTLQLLRDLEINLTVTDHKPEQRWMQTIIQLARVFLFPSVDVAYPFPEYRLVEEIPDDEPFLRNTADFLYVMTLGRQDKLDLAVKVADSCIRREKTLSGTQAIYSLIPFLTRGYLMQGRLRAAAALCREILDLLERNSRYFDTAGSVKIDLGEVLLEWNCLDDAGRYIREGLADNEPWQNIMSDGFGLVALTRVLLAQGDYAGAIQTTEKLKARLAGCSWPRELDEDFHTLRIRVLLAGGDLQSAAEWANQLALTGDIPLHKQRYQMTLARIFLAQGKYAELENLLAGAIPPPGSGSQITRELEYHLLLAIAKSRQGRQPEALEHIKSCLHAAQPDGYVRIFLDFGEPVRALLAVCLQSVDAVYGLYAQKILDAFSPVGPVLSSVSSTYGLVEPLSERELEVLQLMALGNTNHQIAGRLIIAAGTVKAHAASIYRKLDAANRTEAVARAREIGILQ
jgi:LuxR family maltose regulon positive regulatory protein